MKKVLMILLAVSLLAVCAFTVNAAEVGGKCGDNLTWTLSDDEGTLTISGTGPMYDYSEEAPAPWIAEATDLQKIVIESGVTSIGNRAFDLQDAFVNVDVTIPSSVTRIGDYAFRIASWYSSEVFCYYFHGDPPELGQDSLGSVEKIYVVNWDDAAKKRLGADDSLIKEATVTLDMTKARQLMDLNETLDPEDFPFVISGANYKAAYVPRQFSLTPYDNSTYGEKNITITADGLTFPFTYFVTDGTNHLDLINVEFYHTATYTGQGITLQPQVFLGTMQLARGKHFLCNFPRRDVLIGNVQVIVTGIGILEGFEKTFYFPIVKKDITDNRSSTGDGRLFTGEPQEFRHTVAGVLNDRAYRSVHENNINVGTARIRTIGLENCCGEEIFNYEITLGKGSINLPGKCIGTVGGELSDEIPYYERILSPATITAKVENSSGYHAAAYALYKIEEDDLILVKEYTAQGVGNETTAFTYDFSATYERAADVGGEVYLLSYSWAKQSNGEVYAGMMALLIPAKVPEATSMTMTYIEGDGDFRKEFFTVAGDDGVLGEVTWESSDPSVAVVENGTVTFKRPGTVSITAQWGDLVESGTVSVPQLNLSEGFIFDWREGVGTRVIWDNRLLTEGTDYVLSVTKDGDAVTVTATGCGLFTGQLMKTFDGLDSLADPHTHGFDNVCDNTCNGCDFTRANDHSFPQVWTKNQTHHWHACSGCGMQKDLAPHTLSPEDDTVCSICGPLHTPGDLNGDYSVNEDDAIYLLQHILLSEFFPLNQAADHTGDDRLDEDDAIYLLQHVLLPEFFPL